MSERKEDITKCPYTQSKRLLEKGLRALFGRIDRSEHVPSPHGFARLNTSGEDVTNGFPETDKAIVREVGEYLGHVLTGKKGKPLCPFVGRVHTQDGYYLKIVREAPEAIEFDALATELQEEFMHFSPRHTSQYQDLDVTTTVLAFSHPECRRREFGMYLEHERNRLRQRFLDKGHMLAHMFETHDDPKGTGSYQSPIPLLMTRRMHEPDHVFMRTDEEKTTYARFFPPRYPTGIGG